MKSLLAHTKFMFWIVVPLFLWGAHASLGLPHVRWSYSWLDEGQGIDPFAKRNFTSCTYWGPYGSFTIHPNDGNCAWLWLFKQSGGG